MECFPCFLPATQPAGGDEYLRLAGGEGGTWKGPRGPCGKPLGTRRVPRGGALFQSDVPKGNVGLQSYLRF